MNLITVSGLVPALALTLLHTLWQGAAAAGLLWILLRIIPAARSRLRYALSAVTLLATAAGGVLTLMMCWPASSFSGGVFQGPALVSGRPAMASDAPDTAGRASAPLEPSVPQAGLSAHALTNNILSSTAEREAALKDTAGTGQATVSNPAVATHTVSKSDSAGALMPSGAAAGRLWMPWLVGLWSVGVLAGIIGLSTNWRALHRWRKEARPCADGSWDQLFARLLRKVGLSGKVRLLVSEAAPVPVVIGWLRPVVLVPAQLFTGLTAGQLEALLIHELAHIRRHDFPVNLLQSVIGILYFHHPCVRWISSQIRTEREHCCDDTAALLCGGPLPYARALAALEDLRPDDDAPALCAAATGSPLISRIRRLLVPATPVSPPPLWPAALGTTALAALLIGIPWVRADERQAAADQAAPSSSKITDAPSTPAAQPQPTAQPEPVAQPEPTAQPEPVAQPTPDPAPSTTIPPPVREKQALETVNAFLNAPTAEDKILWLLQDGGTRTAAEAFFKRHPEFAKTVEGTSFGPVMLSDGGGASLAMEIPSLEGTYFFMIQPTRQGPRIDLLGSTYYQRRLFQDIQNDLPETPVRIRAIMHPGDYYNKAFADKARHRCYELICPGVDRRFYAYEPVTPPNAENGHAGTPLENVDLHLRAGLQTLEIRYPSSGKDPLQVEIVRIIPREGPPAIPFQKEPEPLQPKAISDFNKPSLSLETSGESPIMPRNSGSQAFDRVALAPVENREPSAEITVRAIKAGSRTHMPVFSLFTGRRNADGGIFWPPGPPMTGEGGEFSLTRKYLHDQGALRVEAEGRIPKTHTWNSKAEVPDEISFELDTDPGTEALATLPDGSPAAGAVIAVALPGRYAVVENGRLRGQEETPPGMPRDTVKSPWDAWARPRISQADDQGRFILPSEPDPNATVVIAHEAGVLEIPYSEFAPRPRAELHPWAKVTGQVLWSGKPGTDGTPVRLAAERALGSAPVTVIQYEQASADADGRFVFEKALPGMIRVSCPLKPRPEAPWPLDVVLTGRETLSKAEPGMNTLLVGGRGRTVTGRFLGRKSWEGVTFSLALQDPPEGTPDNRIRREVFEKFRDGPEGEPFFRNGLKPAAEGSFEISGILPGVYQILVTVPGGDAAPVRAGGFIRIDPENPHESPEPVDTGDLPLANPAFSRPE